MSEYKTHPQFLYNQCAAGARMDHRCSSGCAALGAFPLERKVLPERRASWFEAAVIHSSTVGA